jgi:hypothetical protein
MGRGRRTGDGSDPKVRRPSTEAGPVLEEDRPLTKEETEALQEYCMLMGDLLEELDEALRDSEDKKD